MEQHVVIREKKKGKGCMHYFWMLTGVVFALFVLFVSTFRPIFIEGDSMLPTLHSGEWMLVCRLDRPARGDMTVTNTHNDTHSRLIKRVIAFGGETVDIDWDTGTVYVNGEALDEPYLGSKEIRGGDVSFPLTVPEGCVFLLGDNRTNSTDSRYKEVGEIRSSTLIGTVWFRIRPFPIRFIK